MLEHRNLFLDIIKNDDIMDFLITNDHLDIIHKTFNNIVKKEDVNPEVFYDTALVKLNNKKEYENAIKVFPEIKNYQCDFSNFDYTKSLYFRNMSQIPEEALNHFDFSTEKTHILKTLSEYIFKNVLQNQFMHPKKDFDKFEQGYKRVIDKLKKLDNEENEPENEMLRKLFTKKHLEGVFHESDICVGISNIPIYELDNEKSNAARAMFNVVKHIAEKAEFKEGLRTEILVEKYVERSRGLKIEDLTDEAKSGFKMVLLELNNLNLLNNDNFNKYSEKRDLDNPYIKMTNDFITRTNNQKRLKI